MNQVEFSRSEKQRSSWRVVELVVLVVVTQGHYSIVTFYLIHVAKVNACEKLQEWWCVFKTFFYLGWIILSSVLFCRALQNGVCYLYHKFKIF